MYRVIASFTDAEKFRFIESVWKPDVLFEFPASKETCGKQRKFRQEWLVKYPWLVYSKYLDGAFCLPCVCFGVECGKNGAKLDMAKQNFLAAMRRQTTPVDQQLNRLMQAQIDENRLSASNSGKKNTYDMLNIIFKKCFLVSVGPKKLLNFVDLKQIFILVFILNIFPNMHHIALQSIHVHFSLLYFMRHGF